MIKLPPSAVRVVDNQFHWNRPDLYEEYRDRFAQAGGTEWWIAPESPRYKLPVTEVVQIVGKGPSLDKGLPFEDVTTFCVNQSVRVVEKTKISSDNIIMIQQDRLFDACEPTRGWHLASIQSVYGIKKQPRLLFFAPGDYGANAGTLTAIVALRIAKTHGAKRVVLLAFDGGLGYAESLKCPNYGSKNRFESHGVAIRKEAHALFGDNVEEKR